MNVLELKAVTLAIEGRTLFEPLSVTVQPGTMLVLRGPSGVGKSSLLAFLCGALPAAIAARGRVLLGGEDITLLPPQQRKVGILFQDDLLFPHLSVAGNLGFGLRAPGLPRAQRATLIDEALQSMGLAGFGKRDPATLSGGQKARVSLLRVLLSRPRALLLDEPFAHLDARTRQSVRERVLEEVRRRELPAVMVTHDAQDAQAAGGVQLELNAPPGSDDV